MIVVLLNLLVIVPTLISVPYFTYAPHITITLTIYFILSRFRKGMRLRSTRKLAEKKGGEKFEDLRMEYLALKKDEDKIEIEKKKEAEENFIDKTTDILAYIAISFVISATILLIFEDAPSLVSNAILLTMVLCLVTVTYMKLRGPFHENERKWQKHYKDFCKGYMNDRYQEFLREEREREKEEG